MKKAVFVITRDDAVSERIQQSIAGTSLLEFVGRSGDSSALAWLPSSPPDIVVVHALDLLGANGSALAQELRVKYPETKLVCLLGGRCQKPDECLRITGVCGFANADANVREFSRLLSDLAERDGRGTLAAQRRSPRTLSKRETEVLNLIAGGMPDKQVAAHLGIGVRTIDTHKQHIREKLGLRSKGEMIAYAVRKALS